MARAIAKKFPKQSLLILDKESALGMHTSTRNSGVLHAGIYYEPDSIKAKLCVEGKKAWESYCKERNIDLQETGKFIIGETSDDTQRLIDLKERGLKNKVPGLEIIDYPTAKGIEPRLVLKDQNAMILHSKGTSTMDIYGAMSELEKDCRDFDNIDILVNKEMVGVLENTNKNVTIQIKDSNKAHYVNSLTKYFSETKNLSCRTIINCSGLYADKIAYSLGLEEKYGTLFIKGNYIKAKKQLLDQDFPRTLFYPVPPFATRSAMLGVHTTVGRDWVKLGPSGFPGFWREDYGQMKNFSLNEYLQTCYGYLKILGTPNRSALISLGIKELPKQFKKGMITPLERFIEFTDEEIDAFQWIVPGIRNQLIHKDSGEFVKDFVIETHNSSINILNYSSPGWTSAFTMADYVVENYFEKQIK